MGNDCCSGRPQVRVTAPLHTLTPGREHVLDILWRRRATRQRPTRRKELLAGARQRRARTFQLTQCVPKSRIFCIGMVAALLMFVVHAQLISAFAQKKWEEGKNIIKSGSANFNWNPLDQVGVRNSRALVKTKLQTTHAIHLPKTKHFEWRNECAWL